MYDGAFAEGRAVGGALHVRRAGGGRARVVGRQAADGAAPEEEGEEDLVEAAEQRALLRRLREDTTGFVRAAARGDRARVVAAAHAPPHLPVLTGHVSSFSPYYLDTSRPSPRTNWIRLVPPPLQVAAAHAGVPLEARVRLFRLRDEPWVPQQVLGEGSERRAPARAPACTASVMPA